MSSNPTAANGATSDEGQGKRWSQLVLGIICMAMVANLQYGWTLFVNPIDAKHHWGNVAIQYAFTLFVLVETWLVPFEAYLADRYGPRLLVMAGAFLIAASWIVYARADSLTELYTGAVIGGMGTGLVYGTCIGNAVKWFQKQRGLAAGLTAAGFGAGAALTVIPLSRSIVTSGYEATFTHFALIQGGVVLLAALFLAKPPKTAGGRAPNPRLLHTSKDSTPIQTLASPAFWAMYVAFILVASSGLMATAQLGPLAKGFNITKHSVTLLFIAMPALTFALSLNNLMNGFGRPLFGWISDWIGREYTMAITFTLGAVFILGLDRYGSDPVLFVILAALIFFSWGDIYSIFPALTSDQFGRKYATTNYGLMYTAKGAASFFVPIGGWLALRTGSWTLTLEIAAAADIVAALLILFVVRPLRVRELREQPSAASAYVPAD